MSRHYKDAAGPYAVIGDDDHEERTVTETDEETWLKFDADDDEEASHEANVTQTDRGYVVGWSNTAVGLVTEVDFDTLEDAHAWLEDAGYADYTA